jgi:hypothetical protein
MKYVVDLMVLAGSMKYKAGPSRFELNQHKFQLVHQYLSWNNPKSWFNLF